MSRLVSVVVPVYNASLYLEDCIKSILNQTYSNIEILLINDGSTDNSGHICESYSKVDNRIKVVHQQNSGPSIARNNGIQKASGEFIQFVDSDDQLEPYTIERLIESVQNSVEMVICGFKTINYYKNKRITKEFIPSIDGIFDNNEFMQNFGILYKESLLHSQCNKLYRKSVLEKYNIRFQEGVSFGEDLLFNIDYLKVCKHIAVIKDLLYFYLIFNNNQSLSKIFRENFLEDKKIMFIRVRDLLVEKSSFNGKNKYLIESLYITKIISSFDTIFIQNNYNSGARKKIIKAIISDKMTMDMLKYLKRGSVQNIIVGYLIHIKAINGIYYFFKVKNFLRNYLSIVFKSLRALNNKGKHLVK